MNDMLASSSDLPQRRRRAAPFDVWVRAMSLFFVMMAVTTACAYYLGTPYAIPNDDKEFGAQLEAMSRRVAELEQAGERPLSIVFMGTSRMKNLVIDTGTVDGAARDAGFSRPVVSTYLVVNWGGFERFDGIVETLLAAHPDHVVVMPELLYQDFGLLARTSITQRYIQMALLQQEFVLFDPETEFDQPACNGFGVSAESRIQQHSLWMNDAPDSTGPREAAEMIRQLVGNGTRVNIVPVPPHPELIAVRGEPPAPESLLGMHGLRGLSGVSWLHLSRAIPPDAYCDYAHIAPEKAGLWLDQLFAELRNNSKR